MKVNKFNIHWQIARVNAKDIKCVDSKIHYILNFLYANSNVFNYHRVMNWLNMTKLAYNQQIRDVFDNYINELKLNESNFSDVDSDNDLDLIDIDDIIKVYRDLNKRKYNFQYNKTPKDHIMFMNLLQQRIDNNEKKIS